MTPEMATVDGRTIGWQPTAKQLIALRAPVGEVCYGGEKGSGKSDWLNAAFVPLLQLAQQKYVDTKIKQVRCRTVIFRRNLFDLEDLIAKSHGFFPLVDAAAVWRENDKEWTFGSGATVTYRHLDGPNDFRAYHGQELPGIGFDQVEQIKFHEYVFITANCRSGDPDYQQARAIRATANPGGESWILAYFGIPRDTHASGEVVRVEVENADKSKHIATRVFVRGHLRDNPHLPASYEADLRSRYNADEVAMFLQGDFYRVASSFFSLLLRPGIHFQRSQLVPSTWEFRHATDWGSTNPACTLIGARDQDGRLWVIDELYRPGITGTVYGENLRKMWDRQAWSKDHRFGYDEFWGVIDKQARDKYNGDATAAQGIIDSGFSIYDAKKERLGGCNQMKERMLIGRDGGPRVIIFEDRCPNLCTALGAIPSRAPIDPDDYNPDSEFAHAVDAFRFLCMEFPTQPQVEADPQAASAQKWQALIRKAKERQGRVEVPS